MSTSVVISDLIIKDSTISYIRLIHKGSSSEVHEVRDNQTGKAIAKKIIGISAHVTAEDIQKELRAVSKLCAENAHRNIIEVFGHGQLADVASYYIDMELCDFDLQNCIDARLSLNVSQNKKLLQVELPTKLKIPLIFTIMDDIASGLVFIHSHNHVHRDIKPRNILYSIVRETWKIGDFGIAVEGTSNRPRSTSNAFGTSGYRAPELLRGHTFTYTNKVDIWAMGCILWELVYGEKLFTNDFAVREYSVSGEMITHKPSIIFEKIPEEETFLEIIRGMLRSTPSARPMARKVKYELALLQSKILKLSTIEESETENIGTLINLALKIGWFLRTNWHFFIPNLLLVVVLYNYSSGITDKKISDSQAALNSPTYRTNVLDRAPLAAATNAILGQLYHKPVFFRNVDSTSKASMSERLRMAYDQLISAHRAQILGLAISAAYVFFVAFISLKFNSFLILLLPMTILVLCLAQGMSIATGISVLVVIGVMYFIIVAISVAIVTAVMEWAERKGKHGRIILIAWFWLSMLLYIVYTSFGSQLRIEAYEKRLSETEDYVEWQ